MNTADEIYQLVERLYPICRSITGDGVRQTLKVLQEWVDLEVHEIPSGTKVFDWTVPKEWNVDDAYVLDSDGGRIVDFKEHNLHLMSYSAPTRATVSYSELLEHLHTLPDHPDWIPYRTSYYHENWGFCMSERAARQLDPNSSFDVVIDSSFTDGSLTYGELFLPGKSREEVLIFSHVCHPSLANDNLSGLAVTAALAQQLAGTPRRYSYRFVWAPGTIGSITWLATNQRNLDRISHGLVAVLLGDPGGFNYKETPAADQEIDQVMKHVLKGYQGQVLPFDPYGYDERQFSSPGIRLPVGRITRSPHSAYPEYHTSADNLDLVSPSKLGESLQLLLDVVDVIEHNRKYVNLQPYCEPQLGRRGLYRADGGTDLPNRELAMLWTLNQSDGDKSLLDIAERSSLPFSEVKEVARELAQSELLGSKEP